MSKQVDRMLDEVEYNFDRHITDNEERVEFLEELIEEINDLLEELKYKLENIEEEDEV